MAGKRKITDDGRELAAFVGGRWTGAWYWREDVEAIRADADHASRSFLDYQPTERWIRNPDPELEHLTARVWVPANPHRHVGSRVSQYVPPIDEADDEAESARPARYGSAQRKHKRRGVSTCSMCAELTIAAHTATGSKVLVDYEPSPSGTVILTPGNKPTVYPVESRTRRQADHTVHTVHSDTCVPYPLTFKLPNPLSQKGQL